MQCLLRINKKEYNLKKGKFYWCFVKLLKRIYDVGWFVSHVSN